LAAVRKGGIVSFFVGEGDYPAKKQMSVMKTGNTKRPSDGGSAAAAGEMQEGRDVDGRVVVIVSELRSEFGAADCSSSSFSACSFASIHRQLAACDATPSVRPLDLASPRRRRNSHPTAPEN